MQKAHSFAKGKWFVLYPLGIFFILCLIYLPISLVLQNKNELMMQSEILSSAEKQVDVEKTMVSSKVDRLITDVLYISDSLRLNEDDHHDYTSLKKEWIAFSDRKRIYDQIRFLDKEGNEVVRVNYSEKGAYAVPDSELQNKRDRYYFTDSISLSKGQIYLSPLDLNIENDKIEEPIKPMIRLSTPYFGSDGKLEGIIILNYTAGDMLNQVSKIASTGQGDFFMLNSGGYWLFNSADESKEWAFMYADQKNVSFANEYPDEWRQILRQSEGQIVTDNGVFCFSNIFSSNDLLTEENGYSFSLGDGDYYMISHIPANSEAGQLFSRTLGQSLILSLRHNATVYVLLLLFSMMISVFVIIKRREKEEIRFYSEYDAMTGAYNRRVGFDKLGKLYASMKKAGAPVSVCFVDINGLKEVNDTLGHESGDELIRSITEGIRRSIRAGDFIARLGGDEFIFVMAGMDEAQAEEVWLRALDYYKQINSTENRRYIISASHGIETMRYDSKDFIDTVINRADEKMYQEKRVLKQGLSVIRPQPDHS